VEQIDLLKIDVEKSELEVLEGIEPEDWSKIQQIVVEVHDINGRLAAVEGLLKAQGYQLKIQQETFLEKTQIYNIYGLHRWGTKEIDSQTSKQVSKNRELLENQIYSWQEVFNERIHSELREYLESRLPEYMIPSGFVLLSQLPLTPNGKVDRKALPVVDVASRVSTEYVAPETETQKTLVEIWEEVLGIERVGIHDNFFDLGGHSLMATQVVSRVRQALAMEISITTLFKSSTIAQLAEFLVEQQLEQVDSNILEQILAGVNR